MRVLNGGAVPRELAAQFKGQHPEAYLAVTGRPVWADSVGQEHSRAEAKWLRYVKSNIRFSA